MLGEEPLPSKLPKPCHAISRDEERKLRNVTNARNNTAPKAAAKQGGRSSNLANLARMQESLAMLSQSMSWLADTEQPVESSAAAAVHITDENQNPEEPAPSTDHQEDKSSA